MTKPVQEGWSSRLGVILAVAGSAVGLGNFLRFPGLVAEYGGGAFMIAYALSFLLLGLPIAWAEWAMARHGGRHGYHTAVGVLHAMMGTRWGKYLGVIGIVIPVTIYIYYVVIEAWCLGYAAHFLLGDMNFADTAASEAFFVQFTGIQKDGLNFTFGEVGLFLFICFALNYWLIYRGLSRGIELFCRLAMPALVLLALILLVRVLTLGTPDPVNHPERSVLNGLGFMWNPSKVFVVDELAGTRVEVLDRQSLPELEAQVLTQPNLRIERIGVWTQLANPQMWLAAAGQIFFSLSVGFGVIITYASYLKPKDDVILSGLTAASANEFCEVALGGLITIPAAVAFIGVSGALGSLFSLGFVVLPNVFSLMPLGSVFGFLFFFLLFLAAVTSSLSMLQPGIAFLEGALRLNRAQSVALLGSFTAMGSILVVYFSKDLKFLDTLDFWSGTFLIYILATIQIVVFSWVYGVDRGLALAHEGSIIRVPRIYRFILRYVTPAFLLVIFAFWAFEKIFSYSLLHGRVAQSGYMTDLFGPDVNPVAWMALGLILSFALFVTVVAATSSRYQHKHPPSARP